MKRVIGLTVGLFLLSFLPNMGVLPFDAFAVAASQQQPLPGLGTDEGALSLEGELTAVDAKNRLLWVKTADGKDVKVSYTDRTEIIGAEESEEGLSDRNGSRVRVLYQLLGGINVATKIEILPMRADILPMKTDKDASTADGHADLR
jgi:hypothetical protein